MIYPAHYDLPPIMKNYRWNFSFNITLDDVIMELDGYNIKFRVLLSLETVADDALITLTRDPEDGVTVDEDMWVTLDMPREKTSTLPLGQHKYTVELTQPDGDVFVLACGRIAVVPCDGAGGD